MLFPAALIIALTLPDGPVSATESIEKWGLRIAIDDVSSDQELYVEFDHRLRGTDRLASNQPSSSDVAAVADDSQTGAPHGRSETTSHPIESARYDLRESVAIATTYGLGEQTSSEFDEKVDSERATGSETSLSNEINVAN